MLSYKYYQNPENRNILPQQHQQQLRVINNIFKDEFQIAYKETLSNLANPTNECNKYNIWDILADNAIEILNNSMIADYDKLYLARLLVEFREQNNIPVGVEYYCLRHIIRLSAFRVLPNLKWIMTNMANRINQLQGYNKTKNQNIIFTRNVRKIEIIKRIYKTRVILRAKWLSIYDCYKLGNIAYHELLNQTDILKYLNISQIQSNSHDANNNCDVDIELEKIDKILDEELETESDVNSVIGLVENELPILSQQDDINIDDNMILTGKIDYIDSSAVIGTDVISQPGSDIEDPVIDEFDDIVLEPDEW